MQGLMQWLGNKKQYDTDAANKLISLQYQACLTRSPNGLY